MAWRNHDLAICTVLTVQIHPNLQYLLFFLSQLDSRLTSSSSDEMFPTPDSTQLQDCVEAIQDIVGDTIPHDELVRAALAADCDANRALNFLFA